MKVCFIKKGTVGEKIPMKKRYRVVEAIPRVFDRLTGSQNLTKEKKGLKFYVFVCKACINE